MGRNSIANSVAPSSAQANARLSLLFKPGHRPSAADVLRLLDLRPRPSRASRSFGIAVSHRPEPSAGWLELLAGGLTFDLAGLAPASPAPRPAAAHFYGFARKPSLAAEAITLMPGAALQGMENLLPVIRTMAATASRLARLADVTAIVWHPARSAMAPDSFVSTVSAWLAGGAFPALQSSLLKPFFAYNPNVENASYLPKN